MAEPQRNFAVATMPIEIEECPGWLVWSAFGARYPDTACSRSLDWNPGDDPGWGVLCDADDDLRPKDVPCPWHEPVSFTDYMFGGGYQVPLCPVGDHRLPDGQEIHYHDAEALWWSATCAEHGEQRIKFHDFSEDEGFDDLAFTPWEPRVEATVVASSGEDS